MTSFPDTLSYHSHLSQTKSTPNSFPLLCCGESLSTLFRNVFYLPRYAQSLPNYLVADQNIAHRMVLTFQGEQVTTQYGDPRLQKYFSMRDVLVCDPSKNGACVFKLRVFQSHWEYKPLTFIVFTFHGHTDTEAISWNPLTTEELARAPLNILQALAQSQLYPDSLMTTSFGNVAFESLKNCKTSEERKLIPPTLIINRGLASIKKVGERLYAFPWNCILHQMASLLQWDADPEAALLAFLENSSEEERLRRQVIVIEAREDFYFAGNGGFASDLHERIDAMGIAIFRAQFYPFPYHPRAHHALGAQHLVYNEETRVLGNSMKIDYHSHKSVIDTLIHKVFMNPEESTHTCVYLAGNDATLDIATAREIMPILSQIVDTVISSQGGSPI